MNRKIMELYTFLMLGFMPFGLHCIINIIYEMRFNYIDFFPEIYFFYVFTFAYFFIGLVNKGYLQNRFTDILRHISILFFLISTTIYGITFNIQVVEIKDNALIILFIILCALTILNLIIDIFISVTCHEKETDTDNSENRYEKYSENRYERYLLERIDEKLNSIKNQQSEKDEEKSNNTINSEELLNGSDILAEMLKNHIEIQEYFQISKKQSKFSFYFSISSSVVGIIVVIIAASGIVIFKNLGISIIAAVSGAITEIISGIVLWIHNKSALQLNYYYDSLHENEKFLSALNIADKLSEEKREDMYMEIIRKQIDIQSKDKGNNASDDNKK